MVNKNIAQKKIDRKNGLKIRSKNRCFRKPKIEIQLWKILPSTGELLVGNPPLGMVLFPKIGSFSRGGGFPIRF